MTFTQAFDKALEKLERLKNNRIAKFSYDEDAYDNDTVDGVTDYDFDRHQNIPVSTPTVIQANETMLKKGFRSQASSLPRMFLNHFFGRTSYNVNKIVDYLISFLTDFKSTFSSGQGVATLDENGKLVKTQFPYPFGEANGVATLDNNGRIPASQISETVVEYKGEWNALTNEPELSDFVGDFGDLYYVSVARPEATGHTFLPNVTFTVGDRILKGRNGFFKISGGSVKSINDIVPNSTGNVSISADDIPFENGKSVKERITEIPIIEGAVKSVNTVLPDSNGNVTLTIPSDIGRKDENGNIFIGDLELSDLPATPNEGDVIFETEATGFTNIFGEGSAYEVMGEAIQNEDNQTNTLYPHFFQGEVYIPIKQEIYNAFVGKIKSFITFDFKSVYDLETNTIKEAKHESEAKRFKSFLNSKWSELGFVSNVSNTVDFIYREVD